ncbi:Protein RICE SALT sensitive 3 [Vitis vinifera]|uniref:Protein RICE SALT sensitive 3 n=1 Tax=Vitis vinifera TaxID=29760 RepID=A0A438EI11_VITVI|nr:Protein RICE SALT sensitive 3 [Vitis vinifera]
MTSKEIKAVRDDGGELKSSVVLNGGLKKRPLGTGKEKGGPQEIIFDGMAKQEPMIGQEEIGGTVWEDGFCNFAASTAEINSSDCVGSSVYGNCEFQHFQGLQPELFFKIDFTSNRRRFNPVNSLIGKVAADQSHKWVYKEPNEQEINFLSAWHNSADSYPRTWEAQFQSGTIALIAVREGVIQLGAVHKVLSLSLSLLSTLSLSLLSTLPLSPSSTYKYHFAIYFLSFMEFKVIEDLSYVVLLRKKFGYIESIPGVLLPHPSPSPFPFKVDGYGAPDAWHFQGTPAPAPEFYDHFNQPMKITPSMSSLEALLSKLPSVVPVSSQPTSGYCESQPQFLSSQRPLELLGMEKVTKEEIDDQEYRHEKDVGESSSSMSAYRHQHHFHHHHI